MQSRSVFQRNEVIFDHCSKRCYWSVLRHSEPPFIWCLPHQIIDPENFAVGHDIPLNPTTIHHQDQTATAPQMSFLSPCALLFQQSNLFLICVVRYFFSWQFLARLAKFQGIVSVNDFWFPGRLQELHWALLSILRSYHFTRVGL